MIIKVIGSAEDKPILIKIKDLQYVDGIITDYSQLTNKPQINGHELNGEQTASDLGLGTYSMPDGGIPKSDLSNDVAEILNAAQGLDYEAAGTDAGKALVASEITNGKVTRYSLENITRPYFIETSVPAIYYDQNVAEGSRLSPSALTIDVYRTKFDGSIQKSVVKMITVAFCRADGLAIYSDSRSNASTFTLTVPQNLPPNGYVMVELKSDASGTDIYQRFTMPVVTSPATSKIDKPVNPAVGSFLMWDGNAWIAQALETWHEGGGY